MVNFSFYVVLLASNWALFDLPGLNPEFLFLTSWHTKVKEHSLPYYLLVVGENSWIYTFPKGH